VGSSPDACQQQTEDDTKNDLFKKKIELITQIPQQVSK